MVHTFGSPDPPASEISSIVIERQGKGNHLQGKKEYDDGGGAIPWPSGLGYRRWVFGHMLGYRNQSWREVEVSLSFFLHFIIIFFGSFPLKVWSDPGPYTRMR